MMCGHCTGTGWCELERCARCHHPGPCAACGGTGTRPPAPDWNTGPARPGPAAGLAGLAGLVQFDLWGRP